MTNTIDIDKIRIGGDHACFIIAEAGVNHNGHIDTAVELIRKAKAVGADCVKFQTFKAESVITRDAPKAAYQLEVTDTRESQLDMLKKLELQKEDFRYLAEVCREEGIVFLSTPYNREDVDLLNSLDVGAFKIASGQIVELSFLEYIAEKQKPIILSTGMASLAEVAAAVKVIKNKGNDKIVLLQCTTNYPSKIDEANINAMVAMGDALDVVFGYSDHVASNYACYAAVSLGAKVIEKHFTLDKNMPGPDHKASLDVDEFQELVTGIRSIEASLGSKVKEPTTSELGNIKGMRRSIVAKIFIAKGTQLTQEVLEFKRPGTGISPSSLELLLNNKVKSDIPADTLITFDMIDWQ